MVFCVNLAYLCINISVLGDQKVEHVLGTLHERSAHTWQRVPSIFNTITHDNNILHNIQSADVYYIAHCLHERCTAAFIFVVNCNALFHQLARRLTGTIVTASRR